MPTELRECVDCYQYFELEPAARQFFESRGLQLPRRCGDCRRRRKAAACGPVPQERPTRHRGRRQTRHAARW